MSHAVLTPRCEPPMTCPGCRGTVRHDEDRSDCEVCGRTFPIVAGLRDMRLVSDRYLDLPAERRKAEDLAKTAATTDFFDLAATYYDRTADVDPARRERYLAHIARAEMRGEALAPLLPCSGPILEIGCGTGGLLVAARRRHLRIEGVDIAARWLILARSRLEQAGVSARLTVANSEHLPWPDNHFAAVVADSLVEHLDHPEASFSEWLRVVRPGGSLILWSPNRFSLLPDPHVGLWGLGFLPHAWQSRLVTWNNGGPWLVSPISAFKGLRMAKNAGWRSIEIAAAPNPGLPSNRGTALYEKLRVGPRATRILRRFGPLWQLRAVKSCDLESGNLVGRAKSPLLDPPRVQKPTPRSQPLKLASRMAPLIAAEAFAGLSGLVVLVTMARRLGPEPFAEVESAAALAAVCLVVVRSGVESIVIREAARRPPLIAPLTGTLIGMKLAGAALASGCLGLAAIGASPARSGILFAAGFIFWPSALVADVGSRATGQFGRMAWVQMLRSAAWVLVVFLLVRLPSHAARAASGVGIVESVAVVAWGWIHVREHGWPDLRPRPRAWWVLTRRSGVASLSRLARVALYGADLLILAWSATEFGPYAAARRVVFALVALGLVIPTALAPAIARGWAAGADQARDAVMRGVHLLMAVMLPSAVGLMLTASGWMTILFGDRYRNGGDVSLILMAARLPWLLIASFHLAALVAVRRERRSVHVVAVMVALAVVLVPVSTIRFGSIGAGGAMLIVEMLGAWLGWLELRRLDVHPPRMHADRSTWIATLGMAAVVLLVRNASTILATLAGVATFGCVWLAVPRRIAR